MLPRPPSSDPSPQRGQRAAASPGPLARTARPYFDQNQNLRRIVCLMSKRESAAAASAIRPGRRRQLDRIRLWTRREWLTRGRRAAGLPPSPLPTRAVHQRGCGGAACCAPRRQRHDTNAGLHPSPRSAAELRVAVFCLQVMGVHCPACNACNAPPPPPRPLRMRPLQLRARFPLPVPFLLRPLKPSQNAAATLPALL